MRPYQRGALAEIERAYLSGVCRLAFQLPTGGGKTIILVEVIKGAVARGERVLVLVHRAELLEQTCAALRRAGISSGVIAPRASASSHRVMVAMVATIGRRLDRWRDCFALVVVDECHHSVASTWAAVIASQSRGRILGVTATPERADGRGLGERFDHLIVGPSVAALIGSGWLSPFVVYEPTRGPDLADARTRGGDFAIEDLRKAMGSVVIRAAVEEYRRICDGIAAVAFCIDRAHSEAVADAFRAAGIPAVHIDGETEPAERRAALAGLANGAVKVIANCGLISEGVDIPLIGAALLLRPTQSLALYLQQVGRALRPSLGKARAIILDFAGNVATHGLPDAPREWTLDAKPRRERAEREGEPRPRRCDACGAVNRPTSHVCVECGGDLRTRQERVEIEMRLTEARRRQWEDLAATLPTRAAIDWAGADEDRLRIVARAKGFKPGWAFHQRQRALLRGSAS